MDGRAGNVIGRGLKTWEIATGQTEIESEFIGGKAVAVRDTGQFVAEYLQIRIMRQLPGLNDAVRKGIAIGPTIKRNK